VEKSLKVENLFDPKNIELLHHVNQALKAHTLFKRDVDYVVKNGEVLIVDEFTGRLMPGRRYSEGLHQALEAKEGVKIERENQTLASVTFQNYFRMYEKLAGMTGTADTEAAEFQEIYNLEVMVIPTNMPMIRTDHADVIYRTEREKFEAAIEEIRELHKQGRPVLVGTISIEKSEKLSTMLSRTGVKHHVLNAKQHDREAEIIAQAGQRGAVTISTNMAGRGTDIKLGEGVAQLGGLHILGTERHESRRIDNQLRGRSGRQGDMGSSRFYLSLEDDLLRIFGGERIGSIMDRIGFEEGQPIEANMLSKAIENAQRRVEAHNFDIRKHLLEFDNVMNVQREAIYEQRKTVLKGEDLWGMLEEMLDEVVENTVGEYIDEKMHPEEWNLKGLDDILYHLFSVKLRYSEAGRQPAGREATIEEVRSAALEHLRKKEANFGKPLWDYLMKVIMLQSIDAFWKDHLLGMDHLREGIGLRGYAQKDPIREYQKEGYEMYLDMSYRIRQDTVQKLALVQVQREEEVEDLRDRTQRDVVLTHGTAGAPVKQAKKEAGRVGRNDPCPCGSGKKFKKCCGK
jgi:preprotein translocase subunit SecA